MNAHALDVVASQVRDCQLCPLAATRTLAVPGEGPPDAEIMLVGEAPGANEDKQGRPFVGAAGQFLTELLAAAGLRREDVFICNVLKCRPPGNRDPQPTEIEACRDYLDEQIDLIDPLVIVTLGRFSMAKFFPNQTISRIHGRPRLTAGRCYVPMYHPAAALHQGSLRNVLLEDFRRLPEILERTRAERSPAPAPLLHILPEDGSRVAAPLPGAGAAPTTADVPIETTSSFAADPTPPSSPEPADAQLDGKLERASAAATPDPEPSPAPKDAPPPVPERPAQARLFD